MIEVKKEQMNQIAPLFEGFEDSMVISCCKVIWEMPMQRLLIIQEPH